MLKSQYTERLKSREEVGLNCRSSEWAEPDDSILSYRHTPESNRTRVFSSHGFADNGLPSKEIKVKIGVSSDKKCFASLDSSPTVSKLKNRPVSNEQANQAETHVEDSTCNPTLTMEADSLVMVGKRYAKLKLKPISRPHKLRSERKAGPKFNLVFDDGLNRNQDIVKYLNSIC